VLKALKSGARGYLLKDSAEHDLIQAVIAVSQGKAFFSPAISKMLMEDYLRNMQEGAHDECSADSRPSRAPGTRGCTCRGHAASKPPTGKCWRLALELAGRRKKRNQEWPSAVSGAPGLPNTRPAAR